MIRSSSPARTGRQPPRRCFPGFCIMRDGARIFLSAELPKTLDAALAWAAGANLCWKVTSTTPRFSTRLRNFCTTIRDEAIITSLEFDHADIYADLAAIELQFRRMVNLVPRSGRIVAWEESETVRGVVEKAFCPVETYGFTPGVDWLAGDLEFTEGETRFRVSHRGAEVARVRMSTCRAAQCPERAFGDCHRSRPRRCERRNRGRAGHLSGSPAAAGSERGNVGRARGRRFCASSDGYSRDD